MKASYKVVKTINGHRSGNVIDQFDNIEDARKELANQLMYLGEDDYLYFAGKADAEDEITFAEEAREDWGDDRVNTYIAALREGISSGTPFIANSITGECITAQYDRFSYDNYTVEIEVEEATCEPFEAGTSYPILSQDSQGYSRSVDYVEGSLLIGFEYLSEFCTMSEAFMNQVLDNTQECDHDAIESGEVWINEDRTQFAILYGE